MLRPGRDHGVVASQGGSSRAAVPLGLVHGRN